MEELEILRSFSEHTCHAMKLRNKSGCFMEQIDRREVSRFLSKLLK